MRLLVATILFCLIALAACAADEVPSYAELQVVEAPANGAEQPEARPQRVGVLRFLVATELPVYYRPALDLAPFSSFEAGTFLQAIGWTETDNGEIWVYLGYVNSEQRWVRAVDAPLSPTEVMSLPPLELPELPTAAIRGADRDAPRVEILGASEDGRDVAVRARGSEVVLWMSSSDSSSDLWRWPEAFGVYQGPVWGRWIAGSRHSPPPIWAEVRLHDRGLAVWPGGTELPVNLAATQHPILGRSLDGEWIALRFDAFAPPIAWVPTASVRNELDLESMPVFLSTGMQLFDIDESGQIVGSNIVETPGSWEWRNESELTIGNHVGDDWSMELWDTLTDQRRPMAPGYIGDISPDGRYAVHREWPRRLSHDAGHEAVADVVLIPLDGGEPVTFESVYRYPPTDYFPRLRRWSPDSRWYLSVRFDLDEPTRVFALGVDGRRVEILNQNGLTYEWPDLIGVDGLRYLNEAGEPIDAPWTSDMLDELPQHWSPGPRLGDGWTDVEWSANGRYLLARRNVETGEFTERGYAALPSVIWRDWGYHEIGVFDSAGTLLQAFRGQGFQCGSSRPEAKWSPTGNRIAIANGHVSC